jgi:hypothetical protein
MLQLKHHEKRALKRGVNKNLLTFEICNRGHLDEAFRRHHCGHFSLYICIRRY